MHMLEQKQNWTTLPISPHWQSTQIPNFTTTTIKHTPSFIDSLANSKSTWPVSTLTVLKVWACWMTKSTVPSFQNRKPVAWRLPKSIARLYKRLCTRSAFTNTQNRLAIGHGHGRVGNQCDVPVETEMVHCLGISVEVLVPILMLPEHFSIGDLCQLSTQSLAFKTKQITLWCVEPISGFQFVIMPGTQITLKVLVCVVEPTSPTANDRMWIFRWMVNNFDKCLFALCQWTKMSQCQRAKECFKCRTQRDSYDSFVYSWLLWFLQYVSLTLPISGAFYQATFFFRRTIRDDFGKNEYAWVVTHKRCSPCHCSTNQIARKIWSFEQ